MSAATNERKGLAIRVEGIAFHSPFAPSWQDACAIFRGEAAIAATPAGRPQNAVLAPTERRRAPDTVAIALHLAEAASAAAGRSPVDMASVFASTYGDLAISDYMCETLVTTPRMISPTKFHNSVHNAAAGYWTIGTGCRKASTAVAAGQATFAEALLEAAIQVNTDDDPVLLVCYDIEARGPLGEMCTSKSVLGVALVLSKAEPQSAGSHWLLTVDPPAPVTHPGSELAARHHEHPLWSGLAVFESIAQGGTHTITQALDGGRTLRLVISP